MHRLKCGAMSPPSTMVPLRGLILLVAIILLPTSLHAAEPSPVTLQFERHGLDLDTGTVTDLDPLMPPSDETDLSIGYHADRSPHATLIPGFGAEIALFPESAMADITVDHVTGATFSCNFEDISFSSGSSALVKTSSGSVFLIGDASETDASVSFQYMRVE